MYTRTLVGEVGLSKEMQVDSPDGTYERRAPLATEHPVQSPELTWKFLRA
jgi:hypothetical protein